MRAVDAVCLLPDTAQVPVDSPAVPLDSLGLPADSTSLPLDSARLSRRIKDAEADIERARREAERLGFVVDSLDVLPDSLAAATATDGKKPWKARTFVPNPKKALWLALVFPGAGQIYNRKYWKLPIVYGGFMGCAYALMWNQMMYHDYSQAYLDIMDDDPQTASYLDMLPPRYSIEGREEQFKRIFKNKKNFYRRYRDLSAFCFVGVYILSVVDAYVDAQLSEFDITPDLSLSVAPAVIPQQTTIGRHSASYGVGVGLKF